MKKSRNRGNSNNKNNDIKGNWNGSKKSSFKCNLCGPNRTHNTNTCYRLGNEPQNRSNKVNKRIKNKDQNQNPNQIKPNVRCLQCGQSGHDIGVCKAKQIEGDNICGCGCTYHYASNCPWDNDPLKFQIEAGKARGKICQWCKSTGDGMHDFNECRGPGRFRDAMKLKIIEEYDRLKWCWHCSAENHKTRACDKPGAQLQISRWEGKINEIIQEWTYTDISQIFDLDIHQMQDIEQRPPHPMDFKWCGYCQCFGHATGQSLEKACDLAEHDRRRPIQFKNLVSNLNQVFYGQQDNFQTHVNLLNGPQNNFQQYNAQNYATQNLNIQNASLSTQVNQISIRCITQSCPQMLWFPRYPGKFGATVYCTKCRMPNAHPSYIRKDSKQELVESALKGVMVPILEAIGIHPEFTKKRSWLNWDIDSDKDVATYRKRPSTVLSKKLAVKMWPDSQPAYHDLTYSPTRGRFKAPIFNPSVTEGRYKLGFPGLTYFNKPGNFQDYFPAAKFKLWDEWIDAMKDDSLVINKAGRMGLLLFCWTCRTEGRVVDAEMDYVMCGNDVMSTAGMGAGQCFWLRQSGWSVNRCDCTHVDMPRWAWVDPRSQGLWGR